MGSRSALTAAQWRKIEKILPEKMRNQVMIEAILYREFSGRSLTQVSETFGLTRIRLHTWHTALEADGRLRKIMAALKLEPAGPLARCRSGSRPTYWRNQAMVDAVAAIRLQNFREALRGSR